MGQRFAKLELYLMVARMVQRYHMEYSGPEVGALTHMVSTPDKPINIAFVTRK